MCGVFFVNRTMPIMLVFRPTATNLLETRCVKAIGVFYIFPLLLFCPERGNRSVYINFFNATGSGEQNSCFSKKNCSFFLNFFVITQLIIIVFEIHNIVEDEFFLVFILEKIYQIFPPCGVKYSSAFIEKYIFK